MRSAGGIGRAERVADDLAGVALSVEPGLIGGDSDPTKAISAAAKANPGATNGC